MKNSEWKEDEDPWNSARPEWKEDNDPFSNSNIEAWKDDNGDVSDLESNLNGDGERFGAVKPRPSSPPFSPSSASNSPPAVRRQPGSLLEYQKEYGVLPTCTILTVGEAVNGGILGGAIGLFSGVSEGYQAGIIRQPEFSRFLRSRVIGNALSIGSSLAIWKGGTCLAQGVRKKTDVYNSMFGGFAAGVVFALPSRNPRNILVSGVTYSAIAATFDLLTKQY